MDVSHPLRTVVPSLDGAVLEVLAGTTRPLTGREVARLSGGSVSGVRLVLQRLVQHGLAQRDDHGPSSHYTANRDHLAWSAIEELLSLDAQLEQRISELASGWQIQPESLTLFGSVARREARPDSDIDVLLIEPDDAHDDPRWDAQVTELATSVENWSGNPVQLTILTRSGLAERIQQSDPIIDSWRSDARTLVGRDIRQLL